MTIAGAIFEKKQKDNGRSGLFHVTSPPDLLQEPSILLLPSNGAVNQIDASANRQISGQLKYFHQDGYRHFGLAYSDMSSFAHFYTAYHGANERGWSNDAQDLVEQLIAPNIPSVNSRTGDDRAAQLIDCFYRFRNLKICSHSYGGMMASQLGNAVNAVMDIQGYQPDEKALLIPQIMVLNIAAITNSTHEITKNNPTFTVCDLKSLNDTTLRLADNALSLIEEHVEDYLGWKTPLAVVRYHEHQTGFYIKHAPGKIAIKQSHAMPTYLATHPKVAAEQDPFPFIYPALWESMTDLYCHTGLIRTVEQAGLEKQAQWAWIIATQASPSSMIIDRAQQDEKFAQIWQDATMLDRDNFSTLQYFTPNKIDLPANSLTIRMPATEDDDRMIVAMTDFLLNADFLLNNDRDYQVAIPPS